MRVLVHVHTWNDADVIGIVIDAGKPEYEQGDFLVRGVVGADPEQGSLALSLC